MVVLLATSPVAAQEEARLRPEVERALAEAAAAYDRAPGDVEVRRRYAVLAFEAGDFWRANDAIAPLATVVSQNPADVHLGARLAYGTGDYARAERLFERLLALAEADPEWRDEAAAGLTLVWYQTNRFAEADRLKVPEGEEGGNLAFMQAFEGTPYQLAWTGSARVATVPFDTQDPLPLMKVEVNGHVLDVILDTGANLFVVDNEVAKRIGVEVLTTATGRFAYTGGQAVEVGKGRVETLRMGDVTLRNVPVQILPWRSRGVNSDGVLSTNVLQQFLSTVDYENGGRMVFRERGPAGRQRLEAELEGADVVRMPFTMFSTHFQFARGSLNGHEGLNYFMDSGLALTLPFITTGETLRWMGIEKQPVEGRPFSLFPIDSIGLGPLVQGATRGVTDLLVDENMYWRYGFLFDGLLSHQFVRQYASWTIDFDTMSYFIAR